MSKQKFKRNSLTNFIRRNFDQEKVADILQNYDVSPRVGGLPPQLVPIVARENRASATAQFWKCLEQFVVANKEKIINLDKDTTFSAPQVSALFGTKCVIHARGVNAYGFCPWAGSYAVVCKVSFPEIRADYALKFFANSDKFNNPLREILTAFAANHAEPRNNCPVYLASLNSGYEFMLSQWGGDAPDGKRRENKYEIFYTDEEEMNKCNLRGGRRIDFGETVQTDYGRASFQMRKMFRKIMRAAELGYYAELEYMYHTERNARRRQDLDKAMELVWFITFMHNKNNACNVIERIMKSHQR